MCSSALIKCPACEKLIAAWALNMHLDNECASGHRAPDVCDDFDLRNGSSTPEDIRKNTASSTIRNAERVLKRGSMAGQDSQEPQPTSAFKAARAQSVTIMGCANSVPICQKREQPGLTTRDELTPIAAAASAADSHEQAPDYVMTAIFTSASGNQDRNQQSACHIYRTTHRCHQPDSETSQQNHAHASSVPQFALASHKQEAFEDPSPTQQQSKPGQSPAADPGIGRVCQPEPESLTVASCLPVTAPTDMHSCPGQSPGLQKLHSAAGPAAETGQVPSSVPSRIGHPQIVCAATHVSTTGDTKRRCAIPDDPSVSYATPDAAPASNLPCPPRDENSRQPYSRSEPTACMPSEGPACTHATAEVNHDRRSSPASASHEERGLSQAKDLNCSRSSPAHVQTPRQATVVQQIDDMQLKVAAGKLSKHGSAVSASNGSQGCIQQGSDALPAQHVAASNLHTAPQQLQCPANIPVPDHRAHASSGSPGSSSRPALVSVAEVPRAQARGGASVIHQGTASAAAAAAAAPRGSQSVAGVASKQRTLFGGVAEALPAAKRHSRVPAADKSVPGASSVAGQFVMAEFVSVEEEAQLLAAVDDTALLWKASRLNGPSRGKRWGVQTDLARRTVAPEAIPLPPVLQAVAQRMRDTVPQLADFHPNEANAIEYQRDRGDYLLPHVDDRQLSTGFIVTLSLCGTACMTLSPEPAGRALRAHMQAARGAAPPALKAAPPGAQCGNPAQQSDAGHCRVLLPPRSLQVLSGPARYNFTHGIAADDILSLRRVSITFRQSPLRP